MDNNNRRSSSKQIVGISTLLLAVALAAPQAHAQQPQQPPPALTAAYAKAAFMSLLAIEYDGSHRQAKDALGARPTQVQIEVAEAQAVTAEDASITELLHQIYYLRLRDNDLMAAYQKLAEIESADDASDALVTKRKKDFAVSQFADNAVSIEKRENACFGQLEDSLRQRSAHDIPACSQWVKMAKVPDNVR